MIFKKLPWKGMILVAAIIVLAAGVFLMPGGLAHADNGAAAPTAATTPVNPYACGVTSLGTCILYLAFYIVNAILSLGVSLGIWLVTSFLTFNSHLFDSPTVQTGYTIALGLANLGFVLGIIVIAMATILRNQTYGMKQILWKLVVVAILVNFGLVIARPVVSFSDNMTTYFMNAVGGTGGTASFATNLATAFNQQQLLPSSVSISASDQAAAQAAYQTQCDGAGYSDPLNIVGTLFPDPNCAQLELVGNGKTPNDDFLGNVMSLMFSSIFTCIVVFTLLALSVLLIVRYVWLAMLLILLPLAWATYPFPGLSSHFGKWWSDFIKWTFFPALAMFFIYIALLTAGNNSQNQKFLNVAAPATQGSILQKDPSTGIITVLSTKNNPANPSQLQIALDAVILCALMLGGLFAAASMSGKAGQTAIKTGKNMSNAVTGYVGKKTKRVAQRAASQAVPNSLKNRLQSGSIPVIPKKLQVAAGIGLAKVQKTGTTARVDEEASWAKDQAKDPDTAARILKSGGLSEAKQFAILKALNDNGKFDPTKQTHVGSTDIKTFLADSGRFAKYNQQGLQDDLNKSRTGATKAAVSAANAIAKEGPEATVIDETDVMGKGIGQTVKALDLLQKSLEKSARNMEKNDIKKQNLNYMYSDKTLEDEGEQKLRVEQIKALIKMKPQLIPAYLPKLNSEGLENFEKYFTRAMAEETAIVVALKEGDPTREARRKKLVSVAEAFQKSLNRNALGLGGDEDDDKKGDKEEPKTDGAKK